MSASDIAWVAAKIRRAICLGRADQACALAAMLAHVIRGGR